MDIQRTAAAILAHPDASDAPLRRMNVPWFASPFFRTLLEEASLPPDERALVEKFAKDGYVVIDAAIPSMEPFIDRLIRDLAPQYQGRGRIQDAWKQNADIRALALLPAIDRILRLFYQRDPIPFQTLNFATGTEQATHSDTMHFHCVPHGFMCGVWIALEDIDDESGPLHVYPGSHLLPAWNFHDLGLPSGRDSYHRYEQCLQAFVEALGLPKHVVAVRKGQAVIWAANLLHGGEPIKNTACTRHSLVTHYYFSDCLYYTPMFSDPYIGKMQLRTITDIRTGQTVSHRYAGRTITAVPEPATQLQEAAQTSKSVLKRMLRRFLKS